MKKTYLFYDLETTGLNKAFDQVVQFAAIRTDLALNELERHEILIKLNPDVIPSTHAMITHQISLTDLKDGLCEVEAIRKIHALLNTPGTISLGYNTLNFDDEFLRFSFYRNLLPPYTHQYADECGRMDIYPITLMFYLYKPKALQWPKINDKTSLKLEHLNQANQFVYGQAHNALVDVEATIALAKCLKTQECMWNYLTGYFNKKTDIERMTKLPLAFNNNFGAFKQALLIQGSIGCDKNYQVPVLSLGQHRHYKNQTLWLRLDEPNLIETTADKINDTTWVERKRAGETPLLLPPSTRFITHLNTERKSVVNDNLAWLEDHPSILDAICQYHRDFTYPTIPNLDLDAALYQNGFLSHKEQALCSSFHQTPLKKLSALIETFPEKLKAQAIRVLGRNYPECLSVTQKASFEAFLQANNPVDTEDALIDYRNQPKRTPKEAQAELEDLRLNKDLSEHQRTILTEITTYLKTLK